jgi:hypothetical protein
MALFYYTDEELDKKQKQPIVTFSKVVGGGPHTVKGIIKPLEKLNSQCISRFYLVFYFLLRQYFLH